MPPPVVVFHFLFPSININTSDISLFPLVTLRLFIHPLGCFELEAFFFFFSSLFQDRIPPPTSLKKRRHFFLYNIPITNSFLPPPPPPAPPPAPAFPLRPLLCVTFAVLHVLISKLKTVIQNFAARLVLLAPRHHHSTPLLEKSCTGFPFQSVLSIKSLVCVSGL